MKNLMYSSLESLNCLANVLIVIGFIYIMYLIISIFVTQSSSPSPASFDNVTWRVGAEWDMSDDVMSYLTASTGYLSGSTSTAAEWNLGQELG